MAKATQNRNTDPPVLSVIMPVYNEGPRLFANLQRTVPPLRYLGPCEVIVVNDGSADDSAAEMKRAAELLPEVRTVNLPHAGKGEALRQGAAEARGEFVAFFDADLDLPPEQILFFVAVQRVKKADAVIGSKMHPDSTVQYPLRRRIYSMGYYLLTKLLFGLPVRDTQTGLKLVRRSLLTKALARTKLTGFAFDLELLVRLLQLGARMTEAPVVVDYNMKFGGIGLPAVWTILRDTVKTWWLVRSEQP